MKCFAHMKNHYGGPQPVYLRGKKRPNKKIESIPCTVRVKTVL